MHLLWGSNLNKSKKLFLIHFLKGHSALLGNRRDYIILSQVASHTWTAWDFQFANEGHS